MQKTLIALALLAAGCETPSPLPVVSHTSDRITIQRIGVMSDVTAYNMKRGVYIITDSKTGKEFVGVSGVGVSELGSHHVGKVVRQDER